MVENKPTKPKYTEKQIQDCLDTFKTIPIRNLYFELEAAAEDCRYVLLIDKNENSQIYFTYKATMRDFHKEDLKCQLGMQTKTAALETLRTALVYSMRIGDTFVINLDKLAPDFNVKYTHDTIFPAEEIFDAPLWHNEENYMKVVREDEDHDLLGNKKMYVMRDKFTIAVLSLYDTDERIVDVCNAVPNSEDFVRLIIERQEDTDQPYKAQNPTTE